MSRLLGVENGRILDIGRFNPPIHRGVDVFAPPGSPVVVPIRSTLQITNTMLVSQTEWRGWQAMGWLVMCGDRYGFVAAHLQKKPDVKLYKTGEQYGVVAGHVVFTPHCHIAFSPDHIPPPGTVDPVRLWRRCVATVEVQGGGQRAEQTAEVRRREVQE